MLKPLNVLVACEYSGTVRDAFIKKGHYAVSCDILSSESNLGQHYKGNVFDIINFGWDLLIAHPPCTYLTLAGNRWFLPKYKSIYPTRERDREEGAEFFMKLINAPIKKKCIENPIGVMSRLFRKPDQIIQPFQFGHPWKKSTCLWLENLPLLKSTKIVEPEFVIHNGKKYGKWHYETFNLLRKVRAKERSRTPQGWADAMADQWGSL